MIYGIPKIPDIDSPISSIKSGFSISGASDLPVNRFIPLGYSETGGKYHILFLFSNVIGESFYAHRNKTKYSGYCSSYMLNNGDFFVGYLFVVDPNRTYTSDSHIIVGHDSDEEMQSYPLADDDEGVHIYTTKKCVLVVTAEVNDVSFLVTDS